MMSNPYLIEYICTENCRKNYKTRWSMRDRLAIVNFSYFNTIVCTFCTKFYQLEQKVDLVFDKMNHVRPEQLEDKHCFLICTIL